MKTRLMAWVTVLALSFGVAGSWAQEGGKEKPIEKAKEKATEFAKEKIEGMTGTGQPSPEDMAKMMEAAAPGPEHEHFKTLLGKWDVESSFHMPGAPSPSHSKGTADYKLILGGRFVVEDLKMVGVEDKQPFEGHGVTGFDKVKSKYTGTWMDTWGTSIYTWEGTMDPSGRIMTSTLEGPDCMTKEIKQHKMVEEKVSEDKRVMKMYDTTDGKETLMMEVTYTRKK